MIMYPYCTRFLAHFKAMKRLESLKTECFWPFCGLERILSVYLGVDTDSVDMLTAMSAAMN